MQTLQGLEALRQIPPLSVMTIGNFDGIHCGHRHLLEFCRSLQAPGHRLVVVTFEPHPLTVLRPELAPPRLTPATVKQNLLAAAGVDVLVTLPPTHDVLDLSAENFWHLLRDEARPAHLVEGSTFTFGKARGGNIVRLGEWTANSNVKLHIVDPVEVALLDLSIVPVSSSIIRWLLTYGRVRDAAICLGRPYMLQGEVIQGHQRGRTIGVPTANLQVVDQLVPADGVYSARCTINGQTYAAALSIGTTPTFGDQQRQIEAHILNFHSDLYGRVLQVEILDWLRDQFKFPNLDSLKSQLTRDIAKVSARADADPAQPIAALTL